MKDARSPCRAHSRSSDGDAPQSPNVGGGPGFSFFLFRRSSNVRRHVVALPALQKTFVDFFFEFAWEFCVEKMPGIFGAFLSGLLFPRNEARKLLKEFGENSEQNSGQDSGTKIRKIQGTFILQLF